MVVRTRDCNPDVVVINAKDSVELQRYAGKPEKIILLDQTNTSYKISFKPDAVRFTMKNPNGTRCKMTRLLQAPSNNSAQVKQMMQQRMATPKEWAMYIRRKRNTIKKEQ